MIQAARIIGTGLATTGLIGAGIGTGVTFAFTLLPYIVGISIIIGIFMIISPIKIKDVTDVTDVTEIPGMPGVRCPACAARGVETWVLPGKHCPKCGCACDW